MGWEVLALLASLLGAVWFLWRLISRRQSMPCPAWLSWMVDNPVSMRRTSATLDQLELRRGLAVLDGGCGPGRLAVPIAEAVGPVGSVLAVDVQGEMLRRARAKADKAMLGNIEFLHASLGEGKLPAAHFDRAVMSTVLGEIPDRVAALREIHRALKPGGFLLVNEVIGDPHYQSLARVRAMAQEAGFRPGLLVGSWMAYSLRLDKEKVHAD